MIARAPERRSRVAPGAALDSSGSVWPATIDISAITPFNADTLYLGELLLGVDWVLGPSDRFARYAFNVEVVRILTDRERQQLPSRTTGSRASAISGRRRTCLTRGKRDAYSSLRRAKMRMART